jgi:hypothetical protein
VIGTRRGDTGGLADHETLQSVAQPLQREEQLLGGLWRDRWRNEQTFRTAWAAVFTGLAGIPLGLVYFLFVWVLRDSFKALGSLVEAGVDVDGGPITLLVLASLPGGWFAHWLAQRLLGSCGWRLWIPVVAFAGVAVGVGLGLGGVLTTLELQTLGVSFLLSGAVLLLVAGLRIHLA